MKRANSKQKKFMSDIAAFIDEVGLGGLYGVDFEGRKDFHLHHVLGRSAKHNKVEIGHWFIIPVPIELHDVSSNNPLNVTHNKKNFVAKFGDQRGIFQIMYSCMDKWCDFGCNFTLPPKEVYEAIMETNA